MTSPHKKNRKPNKKKLHKNAMTKQHKFKVNLTFKNFQKKSQILISFQNLVQKIEKYIKIHILGDFGDI
jgi:hypothetical protein